MGSTVHTKIFLVPLVIIVHEIYGNTVIALNRLQYAHAAIDMFTEIPVELRSREGKLPKYLTNATMANRRWL